jgi:hypothetical protein
MAIERALRSGGHAITLTTPHGRSTHVFDPNGEVISYKVPPKSQNVDWKARWSTTPEKFAPVMGDMNTSLTRETFIPLLSRQAPILSFVKGPPQEGKTIDVTVQPWFFARCRKIEIPALTPEERAEIEKTLEGRGKDPIG